MNIRISRLRESIRRVIVEMSVYDKIGNRKLQGKNFAVLQSELDTSKLSGLAQATSEEFTPKPNGLWYGCDDGWIQYVNDPSNRMKDFKKHRTHVYTLEINYTTLENPSRNAVCKIDSDEELDKFMNEYAPSGGRFSSPDWLEFSKHFGGIEFCPLSSGPMWIRGYDVDSGCIWNGAAIQSSELILHDPDSAAKPKATSIGHAFELYPEIYETFCEYRDIDEQGFEKGLPYWSKSIEEFINEHGELPQDKDGWGYRFNDVAAASVMLEFLSDPSDTCFHRITYSSIDIDEAYEKLQKAFKEFGVSEPDNLEGDAENMSDNRDMDAAIGVSDYSQWY